VLYQAAQSTTTIKHHFGTDIICRPKHYAVQYYTQENSAILVFILHKCGGSSGDDDRNFGQT